jgi:hypothetical protein
MELENFVEKAYHNVCPLFTYKKQNFCYADPVTKANLAIFPEWNEDTKQLNWIFTMENSEVITP